MQQQQQSLAAIVCSPLPSRYLLCAEADARITPDNSSSNDLMTMVRFDRDDAERDALFHTVLLRVISQFSKKGNLSLEREGHQTWTIMSCESKPLLLEFTLQHRRVQVLTHPTVRLGTRSVYSIAMLLPGPTVTVSELPLMAHNNTTHILEALKAMAPTLFLK